MNWYCSIFFIVISWFLPQLLKAQDVVLVRSLQNVTGGLFQHGEGNGISISYSIGQASLISHFSLDGVHLFQGFQQPILGDGQYEELPVTTIAGRDPELFPIPSDGQIIARWGDVRDESTQIKVSSLNGRELHKETIIRNGNQIMLDLKHLDEGYYMLSIEDESHRSNHKILIIK